MPKTKTREATVFINALPRNAKTAIALGVLLVHRRTHEERVVDVLVPDPSITTVFKALREKGGISMSWGFYESWIIDSATFRQNHGL